MKLEINYSRIASAVFALGGFALLSPAHAETGAAIETHLQCRVIGITHVAEDWRKPFWMKYLVNSASELRAMGLTSEEIKDRTGKELRAIGDKIARMKMVCLGKTGPILERARCGERIGEGYGTSTFYAGTDHREAA